MDFIIGSIVVSVKEKVMVLTFPNRVETISLDHISSVELTKLNINLIGISMIFAILGLMALIFVNVTASGILIFLGVLFFIAGFFACETLTFHVNGRGKIPIYASKRKTTKLYEHVSEILNTRE